MIFAFDDYKSYLIHKLDSDNGLGRGGRSQLCLAMNCQSSYLSQVLNGKAHLSLEQADALRDLLAHHEKEHDYFILMVEHARAGTSSLQRHFAKKLTAIRKTSNHLGDRIKAKETINEEAKRRYYSTWYIPAIHILLTIANFRTLHAISQRLRLDSTVVLQSLEFLVSCGLAKHKGGVYEPIATHLHLGHDSDLTARYHLAWRMRAMSHVEMNQEHNIHYTSTMTLSAGDVAKVREKILAVLQDIKSIVRPSPAEEFYTLSLDWFKP